MSRLALAWLAAALLSTVLGTLGASAGTATTPASAAITPHGPAFQLEGLSWKPRQSVEVYRTWDTGPCVIDGIDLSGPASAMNPAVALEAFQLALQEINHKLRGGLMLVDAGPATRADLCSQDAAHPIVIGFGSVAGVARSTEAAALALSFGLTTSTTPAESTYRAARVFLSSTYASACLDRDLRFTITHELLHAIGVGHSEDETAVMAPVGVACSSSYLLQPDDVAALTALYPPVPTGTGPGAFAAAPVFGPTSAALVVFNGGSVEQLEAAARALEMSGMWTQDAAGTYQLLVLDGPLILKDAFVAAFPRGFNGATAIVLVR